MNTGGSTTLICVVYSESFNVHNFTSGMIIKKKDERALSYPSIYSQLETGENALLNFFWASLYYCRI